MAGLEFERAALADIGIGGGAAGLGAAIRARRGFNFFRGESTVDDLKLNPLILYLYGSA